MPDDSIIARLLIRHRYLLAAVWGMLVLLGAILAPASKMDRSIDELFDPRDEDVQAYRELTKLFGSREPILVAYSEPQSLQADGLAMQRLTSLDRFLDDLSGVDETISLVDLETLTQDLLGTSIIDDHFFSRRLLELLEGFTHSRDRKTLAILCLVERQVDRGAVISEIREWLAQHSEEYPEAALVGEPVMVDEGLQMLQRDGDRLTRNAAWLMAAVLLLSFGSLRWMLVAGVVVQSSLWVTRLIMMLGGFQLSLVSSMFSSVVTVIAVAAVMHWIIRFHEAWNRTGERSQAMDDSLKQLFKPMVWACLTDAAGFAALLVASVSPVRDFGWIMILGSLSVLGSLLCLVPALILFPLPGWLKRLDGDPRPTWQQRLLDRQLDLPLMLTRVAPRRSIVTLGLACLVITGGLLMTRVETDFTKNFRSSSRIVSEYRFVEDRLGGAGVWDILVPLDRELDWQSLQEIQRLEERLRNEVMVVKADGTREQGLTKVLSVADAILAVVPFDLSRIPRVNDFVVSQGLAELDRRMPSWLDMMLTQDPDQPARQVVRILLRSRQQQSAEQRLSIIRQVEDICGEASVGERVPMVTGWYVLLTRLVNHLMADQLLTFAVATLAVWLMMCAATGHWKLSLIALVPNLLPIGVVLGTLGWLNVPINMGVALIAAVSIGLSIDSTLHYLAIYRRAQRRGSDSVQAIHEAQHRAGLASCFATLALIAGFATLMTSEFVPTVYFGGLVCASMLGGLGGNLVLLPLLLRVQSPKQPTDRVVEPRPLQ